MSEALAGRKIDEGRNRPGGRLGLPGRSRWLGPVFDGLRLSPIGFFSHRDASIEAVRPSPTGHQDKGQSHGQNEQRSAQDEPSRTSIVCRLRDDKRKRRRLEPRALDYGPSIA